MAKQPSAEQTEKPTQKRLKDARREGDIAKSRELTGTVLVLCWLVMAWLALPRESAQVSALMQQCLDAVSRPGTVPSSAILLQAFRTLLGAVLPWMLAAGAIGLLTEF